MFISRHDKHKWKSLYNAINSPKKSFKQKQNTKQNIKEETLDIETEKIKEYIYICLKI
jgi:hypothetical protein